MPTTSGDTCTVRVSLNAHGRVRLIDGRPLALDGRGRRSRVPPHSQGWVGLLVRRGLSDLRRAGSTRTPRCWPGGGLDRARRRRTAHARRGRAMQHRTTRERKAVQSSGVQMPETSSCGMAPPPAQLWQRAPCRPVSRPRPEHPAQVSQLVMRTWTSSRSSTARRAGPSRVLRRPRVDSATLRNWARTAGSNPT